MKTRTVYIASDGTEFFSETSCLHHENRMSRAKATENLQEYADAHNLADGRLQALVFFDGWFIDNVQGYALVLTQELVELATELKKFCYYDECDGFDVADNEIHFVITNDSNEWMDRGTLCEWLDNYERAGRNMREAYSKMEKERL